MCDRVFFVLGLFLFCLQTYQVQFLAFPAIKLSLGYKELLNEALENCSSENKIMMNGPSMAIS